MDSAMATTAKRKQVKLRYFMFLNRVCCFDRPQIAKYN